MPAPSRTTSENTGLIVYEAHRQPNPSAAYVDQVIGSGDQGIEFRFFGGMLRSYDGDVVHIHRDLPLGRRSAGGLRRVGVAVAFVALLKRHRIALVRTLHEPNAARHGRWERVATWIVDRATTTFVVLDPDTPVPGGRRAQLVPYGHFRDRYLGYPRADKVDGLVLCIGSEELTPAAIRPVRVFSVTRTPGLTLRLVGQASRAVADAAARAVDSMPEKVSARLERVSDAAMVQEISAAEIVSLPGVERPADRAIAFLALSLERPLLVRDGRAARRLAEEVGDAWVRRYSGPITAAIIDGAVEAVRSDAPGEPPRLDGRDWDTIAAKYADVFRAAAARVRRR